MKFTHLLLSFLVFIIFTSEAHAWAGPFFDRTASEYGQVCDFRGTEAEVTFRKTDKLCNKHVFYEYEGEGESGEGVIIFYHIIIGKNSKKAFYSPGELCAFIRHSLDPDNFTDRVILFYHYRKNPEESCSATVSDKASEAPCTTVTDKASGDPCTTASDKYPRKIPTTFQEKHPLQTELTEEDELKVYAIKISLKNRQLSCSELKDEFPQFLINLLKKLKLTTK